MAKPKDSEIEKRLDRTVKKALHSGEEITFRIARSRVEAELSLGDGFFKVGEWKEKSKKIINAAIAEVEAESEEASKSPSPPVAKAAVKSAAPVKASKTTEGQKKEAPQANGVKRKADVQKVSDVSGSSSGSGEESSEDEHKAKRARTSSTSASEESSGGDAESSTDDSTEGEDEDTTTKTAPSQAAAKAAPSKSLPRIPAKPFEPPQGFAPLHPSPNESFTPSKLGDKQIWHITAPSNLPLTSIRDLLLSEINSGTPILTHDNSEYILHQEHNATTRNEKPTLLLPTSTGYALHPTPISRQLNLQQNIVLPNLTLQQASQSTGSAAASQIAQPAVKSTPSQPKGLRMRYKPPGFGCGKPGRIGDGSEESSDDVDDVDEGAAAGFQFPRALGAHATREQQGINELIREDASRKETKKKKKDSHKDGEADEGRALSSAQLPVVNGDGDVSLEQAVTVEEREDKAKRKEARRLKREERKQRS